MKRITAFILALVLVLSLGGCRKAADPRAELPEETKQALDQLPATVANPDGEIKAYRSLKALNRASGARIVMPEGHEIRNELFETTTLGELEIGQYIFTLDGIPCVIRFCKQTDMDASGVTGLNGGSVFAGVKGDTVFGEGSILGRWNTSAGQYVLIAATDDIIAFTALFDQLKASVPG